jgi:hypothetical protein
VKVLKLTAQAAAVLGNAEQAALHYAAEDVRWEAGVEIACFRGGHNAVTGKQSVIHINSIIGTKGMPNINPHELLPGLTNGKLFARDRCVCAYCGRRFHESDLTREHIVPVSTGGQHSWMNLVTACRACNHRKGARTPEQARMPLLYTPTRPRCGRTSSEKPPHSGRPDGVSRGPCAVDHAGAARAKKPGLAPRGRSKRTETRSDCGGDGFCQAS